jgi:uncharacterized damage-inducible protein DinB
MSLSQSLLAEFGQEMANTRKTLERVPEERFSWKPHAKSGSMIWLAGHLSNIPGWVVEIVKKDALDMAPGGKPIDPPPTPKNGKDLLQTFDKNVADARAALAAASDTDLQKSWSFLNNGTTLFSMPRSACLRTWVMNHNIHHRAQLGVYLRLNNLPVPAIYGPSADESGM